MRKAAEISRKLLQWYDANARELPWRVPPNEARRANPYHVWLSEIMLQQTTVTAVKPYFEAFTTRWPDVAALAAAKDEDVLAAWAGLGYYARARNLLKCARVVAESGFPENEAGLLALPGVGPYTAAAIAAIAYGASAVVVDGNIERVMARLFNEHEALPAVKPSLKVHAARLTPPKRAGDHAQALMDLGATICIPKTPRCAGCPLQGHCAAYEAGSAAELPKRLPKNPKPTRRGIAYFALRTDGHVLLETRPPKGLLGGMLGLVGSEWAEASPAFDPPFAANWQPHAEDITHAFTHFNLILTLYVAQPKAANPRAGSFQTAPAPEDLPSIMRKAYEAGFLICNIDCGR
ncbi:MAG: A/G-specific adenine glycosylase [Rhodobacteraceae bacterium]|nr:A/G-specific adenine glycosylase [Paracoccaceae bacterium]